MRGIYDDVKPRNMFMSYRYEAWFSHLSHSASYDGDPQYCWIWGVTMSKRRLCVKDHLDRGSMARSLPSLASHLGEVVVMANLRPSRTIWDNTEGCID
jgi:hypothetical protein